MKILSKELGRTMAGGLIFAIFIQVTKTLVIWLGIPVVLGLYGFIGYIWLMVYCLNKKENKQ